MILDAPSAIVDIGHKRRLFTRAMRDTLGLSNRTCMWPGCDLPAGHCQTDHIHPWSRGGATSVANGAPTCGHHNRFKHHNDYQTWRDQHGTWHITRPDGTETHAPPQPLAGH